MHKAKFNTINRTGTGGGTGSGTAYDSYSNASQEPEPEPELDLEPESEPGQSLDRVQLQFPFIWSGATFMQLIFHELHFACLAF